MTRTIARATNDRGQVVELHHMSRDGHEQFSVVSGRSLCCGWADEKYAYFQFALACGVREDEFIQKDGKKHYVAHDGSLIGPLDPSTPTCGDNHD